MSAEAKEYGQRIAEMLAASTFPDEQKAAWAALVPVMTLEQLKRFDALLKLNMHDQVEQEFEDVLTTIRAKVTEHELKVGVAQARHSQDLDALEKEFKALEAAAQQAA